MQRPFPVCALDLLRSLHSLVKVLRSLKPEYLTTTVVFDNLQRFAANLPYKNEHFSALSITLTFAIAGVKSFQALNFLSVVSLVREGPFGSSGSEMSIATSCGSEDRGNVNGGLANGGLSRGTKNLGGFVKGVVLANAPSFRFVVSGKSESGFWYRGNIRQNHPFGNHPFANLRAWASGPKGAHRAKQALSVLFLLPPRSCEVADVPQKPLYASEKLKGNN